MSKISVVRAKKLIDKGGKIFDVRSPVDFARNSIAASINLPLRNISHIIKYAKQKDNIVLIGDENTSKELEMAENYLIQLGFLNVFTISNIAMWNVLPTHK